MKKIIIGGLLALVSLQANAGMVYLDCHLSENRLFKVTLNEADSSVTQDFGTGLVRKYNANFTPDTVQYFDAVGKLEESIFTINRSTLDFTREMPELKKAGLGLDQGYCEMKKANKSNQF